MDGLNQFNNIIRYSYINKVMKKIKGSYKNKKRLKEFYMYYNINIYNILTNLYKDTYKLGKYKIFLIREPKYRLIMSEDIIDKVVNHLISTYILIPSLESKLIYSNVATRKNKGSKVAYSLVKKYINELLYKNKEIYALKIDISKYFYNIDHNILFNMVKKYIIDNKSLDFIKSIIDSTNDNYVNLEIERVVNEEKKKVLNSKLSKNDKLNRIKELDKIPRYKKGKGLPIGNLSSQILAIYYLNEVDHFIKEILKCKYYVRYMDDLVILDTNRDSLKGDFNIISKEINKLKLNVNKKSRIYNLNNGFIFLGYKFIIKDNKLIIRYKSDTYKRINKRLKNLFMYDKDMYYKSKTSYNGYLSKKV